MSRRPTKYPINTIRSRFQTVALDNKYQIFIEPSLDVYNAAAAVGTDIYVFGGTDDTDGIVYHVDKFDTVSETWSTLTQTMVNAYRDVAGL